MDETAALDKVRQMISLVEAYANAYDADRQAKRYYSAAAGRYIEAAGDPKREAALAAQSDELRHHARVARAIAGAIDEGQLGERIAPTALHGHPWSAARNALVELEAALAQREEIERIVGPRGPQLSASRLDPWVWEVAVKLWDDGHYREAVEKATTAVEVWFKVTLDRQDLAGTQLAEYAFAPGAAPEPGKARLRIEGYPDGSATFKDVHQGAQRLGQAVFLGIRNVVHHTVDEIDEQLALEYLATVSTFARWVRAAKVITTDER